MTALDASPAVPAMSPRRLIGAYLSDAKYESIRLFRTPAFSIPILAMPILMYSFFGVLLAGGRSHGGFANLLFVGWTVFAVMGPGLFGFGILVAVERNQGLLTFKRALPMPAGSYLASKLMMAWIFAVGVMVMLVIAGLTIGHVTMSAMQLITVASVMSLGVIPACAVGLLIGVFAPSTTAPAIANITYLAMAFLSGLFFPLPPGLQAFRPLWPTYHLAQLALSAAHLPSQGSMWTHAAVLVIVTIVLTTIAARKLSRLG